MLLDAIFFAKITLTQQYGRPKTKRIHPEFPTFNASKWVTFEGYGHFAFTDLKKEAKQIDNQDLLNNNLSTEGAHFEDDDSVSESISSCESVPLLISTIYNIIK